MYLYIWKCCDYLLLRRQLCALLELKIADCAGQGKVAIDATKVDEASSSLNSCLLGCYQLVKFFHPASTPLPSFWGLWS
jgi:hypothetical protein